MDAIMKTTREVKKDKKADDQIPWLGAGIGIILGVTIVIADQLLTTQPSLTVRSSNVFHDFAFTK